MCALKGRDVSKISSSSGWALLKLHAGRYGLITDWVMKFSVTNFVNGCTNGLDDLCWPSLPPRPLYSQHWIYCITSMQIKWVW